MQKSTIYICSLLLIGIVIACNKSKLNTRPTIKVIRVENTVIPLGSTSPLIVEFDYTDKEGDISNSMFVQKIRLNKIVVPTVRDTFSLPIPNLGVNRTDGQIEIRLYPTDLQSAQTSFEPDTMNIRFALRDKAGNVSDTVSIGQVVLFR